MLHICMTGTFEGLLTIVFDCYVNKQFPTSIQCNNIYQTNMLNSLVKIETDTEKSDRIKNGIIKNISYDVFFNSYVAFLSNSNTKELSIVKYLCHSFVSGPSVHNMLSIPYVFEVHDTRKRVLLESHRLKGLLRFISITDNLFYSIIHPDNDIIEFLGTHFTKRLSNINFIIIDKVRNKSFVYDTKKYQIMDVTNLEIPQVSEEETEFQNMWKAFFKTIAIKERTNPKLQATYMPRRYWKDLIEID